MADLQTSFYLYGQGEADRRRALEEAQARSNVRTSEPADFMYLPMTGRLVRLVYKAGVMHQSLIDHIVSLSRRLVLSVRKPPDLFDLTTLNPVNPNNPKVIILTPDAGLRWVARSRAGFRGHARAAHQASWAGMCEQCVCAQSFTRAFTSTIMWTCENSLAFSVSLSRSLSLTLPLI